MAAADQSTTRVAQAVVGDLDQARAKAAQEILPKGGPGGQSTTQALAVQHLRAAWQYPDLRMQIFNRYVPAVQGPDGQTYPARNGLRNWENLVRSAFPNGYPEPLPPPMLGAGGFAPDLGL